MEVSRRLSRWMKIVWIGLSLLTGTVALSQLPSATVVTSPVVLNGKWQGIWMRPQGDTRTVLTIKRERKSFNGRIEFPDEPGFHLRLYQDAKGPSLRGNAVTYTIVGLRGAFHGTMSEDGNTIRGSWEEGGALQEWNLQRITAAMAWPILEPTAHQLHDYLNASYRQSLLIAPGATPFHLAARIEFYKDRITAATGTLDEVWRDPLHWRLELTYRDSKLTEVSNGPQSFILDKLITKPSCCYFPDSITPRDVLRRAEWALLNPIRLDLLGTLRLTLVGGEPYKDSTVRGSELAGAACIDAQPELSGVPANVAVASVRYCIAPSDFSLRYVKVPEYDEGYILKLYDVTPFKALQVPRTIEIWRVQGGSPLAKVTVTALEPAADFTALSEPVPSGAKQCVPHSQDSLFAGDLIRGEPISSPILEDLQQKALTTAVITTVSLRLHVDEAGNVTSAAIGSNTKGILTSAMAEEAKKLKFTLSYQNGHPVPIDYDLTLWTGTP